MTELQGKMKRELFRCHPRESGGPGTSTSLDSRLRGNDGIRLPFSFCLFPSQSGQATSEILLLMPLFMILVGGAISIGYMCWQGIKVQQAANLAARVQGEERISGGVTPQTIVQDNGIDAGGDQLPSNGAIQSLANNPAALNGLRRTPSGGVYLKFYKLVQNMFSAGEQPKLFVPVPVQGFNTDKVEVVRVLNPPKILNMKLPPVKLDATAYGGEDPHMYGLPRWGRSGNSNALFYQSAITNPNND